MKARTLLLLVLMLGTYIVNASAFTKPKKYEVEEAILAANSYWQSHHSAKHSYFWNWAVYHVGNMEVYKLLKDNQYIMAKKGSVPQKSNFGVDYWKPVIYISSREFRKLTDGLGIVSRGIDQNSNSPTLRHDYVEAMKSLVRTMLPGISESQMDNLSNSQIMDQISGLNYRTKAMTSALNSYSLRDIEDPNVVTNEKFSALISSFMDKYRRLQRIRDNKYNFSIKRGKEIYYWIPADDLP